MNYETTSDKIKRLLQEQKELEVTSIKTQRAIQQELAYNLQRYTQSLIHHTKLTLINDFDLTHDEAEKLLYSTVVQLYGSGRNRRKRCIIEKHSGMTKALTTSQRRY